MLVRETEFEQQADRLWRTATEITALAEMLQEEIEHYIMYQDGEFLNSDDHDERLGIVGEIQNTNIQVRGIWDKLLNSMKDLTAQPGAQIVSDMFERAKKISRSNGGLV